MMYISLKKTSLFKRLEFLLVKISWQEVNIRICKFCAWYTYLIAPTNLRMRKKIDKYYLILVDHPSYLGNLLTFQFSITTNISVCSEQIREVYRKFRFVQRRHSHRLLGKARQILFIKSEILLKFVCLVRAQTKFWTFESRKWPSFM